MKKEYCKEYIKKGLDSIVDVMVEFLVNRAKKHELDKTSTPIHPKTPANPKTPAKTPVKTPNSANSCNLFFDFSLRNDPVSFDITDEIELIKTKKEFEAEVKLFCSIITSDKFKNASELSTKAFWIENRAQLPNMAKLANILLNIPASSAFVERFFSICGVVCKARSMSMTDELIIMRVLLKTNIHLLKELNETFESNLSD